MKNILFYTDTPLLGGAENQMLLLAKNLAREQYSVTVACSSHQALNPWCQQLIGCGVRVHRIKVFHKHDPRHFICLKKILPKFDLLHLHVWNPASCRYGFLAAGKAPLVITEHDPFPLKGLKSSLKNFLLRRVDAIIVASYAARELVLQQDSSLGSRIAVIPNGIDIDEWKALARFDAEGAGSRYEFRRKNFNCKGTEKIILCVAELHERKGQKYLIEAMKSFDSGFPVVRLMLVGDGSMRKYYEKLARSLGDRVKFLGRHKDIPRLMAASDIFVLPSIREAFGLVILEATASGIPVVGSRTGGIAEIIEHGKTGLLAEPANSEDLALKIRTLINNPETCRQFVAAAQMRLEEKYDAKTMAMKTAEVYDKALRANSNF